MLQILCEHADPVGGLRVDSVLADVNAVADEKELRDTVRTIGARLLLSELASDNSADLHDPLRLADAVRAALATAPRRTGGHAWR